MENSEKRTMKLLRLELSVIPTRTKGRTTIYINLGTKKPTINLQSLIKLINLAEDINVNSHASIVNLCKYLNQVYGLGFNFGDINPKILQRGKLRSSDSEDESNPKLKYLCEYISQREYIYFDEIINKYPDYLQKIRSITYNQAQKIISETLEIPDLFVDNKYYQLLYYLTLLDKRTFVVVIESINYHLNGIPVHKILIRSEKEEEDCKIGRKNNPNEPQYNNGKIKNEIFENDINKVRLKLNSGKTNDKVNDLDKNKDIFELKENLKNSNTINFNDKVDNQKGEQDKKGDMKENYIKLKKMVREKDNDINNIQNSFTNEKKGVFKASISNQTFKNNSVIDDISLIKIINTINKLHKKEKNKRKSSFTFKINENTYKYHYSKDLKLQNCINKENINSQKSIMINSFEKEKIINGFINVQVCRSNRFTINKKEINTSRNNLYKYLGKFKATEKKNLSDIIGKLTFNKNRQINIRNDIKKRKFWNFKLVDFFRKNVRNFYYNNFKDILFIKIINYTISELFLNLLIQNKNLAHEIYNEYNIEYNVGNIHKFIKFLNDIKQKIILQYETTKKECEIEQNTIVKKPNIVDNLDSLYNKIIKLDTLEKRKGILQNRIKKISNKIKSIEKTLNKDNSLTDYEIDLQYWYGERDNITDQLDLFYNFSFLKHSHNTKANLCEKEKNKFKSREDKVLSIQNKNNEVNLKLFDKIKKIAEKIYIKLNNLKDFEIIYNKYRSKFLSTKKIIRTCIVDSTTLEKYINIAVKFRILLDLIIISKDNTVRTEKVIKLYENMHYRNEYKVLIKNQYNFAEFVGIVSSKFYLYEYINKDDFEYNALILVYLKYGIQYNTIFIDERLNNSDGFKILLYKKEFLRQYEFDIFEQFLFNKYKLVAYDEINLWNPYLTKYVYIKTDNVSKKSYYYVKKSNINYIKREKITEVIAKDDLSDMHINNRKILYSKELINYIMTYLLKSNNLNIFSSINYINDKSYKEESITEKKKEKKQSLFENKKENLQFDMFKYLIYKLKITNNKEFIIKNEKNIIYLIKNGKIYTNMNDFNLVEINYLYKNNLIQKLKGGNPKNNKFIGKYNFINYFKRKYIKEEIEIDENLKRYEEDSNFRSQNGDLRKCKLYLINNNIKQNLIKLVKIKIIKRIIKLNKESYIKKIKQIIQFRNQYKLKNTFTIKYNDQYDETLMKIFRHYRQKYRNSSKTKRISYIKKLQYVEDILDNIIKYEGYNDILLMNNSKIIQQEIESHYYSSDTSNSRKSEKHHIKIYKELDVERQSDKNINEEESNCQTKQYRKNEKSKKNENKERSKEKKKQKYKIYNNFDDIYKDKYIKRISILNLPFDGVDKKAYSEQRIKYKLLSRFVKVCHFIGKDNFNVIN